MKLSTLKFEVMAMFNQRKSFFKGKLFYMILFALFAFGIWLNQAPAIQDSPEDANAYTESPVATEDAVQQGNSGSYDIMDSIIGNGQTVTPGGIDNAGTNPNEPASIGYYLVKEVDGTIKIFYYDEEGKESLIRETDIAFSLLSTADQALFQKGVVKHTPEELDELLQDFES
jgi:hypothetical protein